MCRMFASKVVRTIKSIGVEAPSHHRGGEARIYREGGGRGGTSEGGWQRVTVRGEEEGGEEGEGGQE